MPYGDEEARTTPPAGRPDHGLPVRLGDDGARRRRRSRCWASPTRSASSRPTGRPTCSSSTRSSAARRGLEVIIAAAGGAAHLPGMTAAKTPLPVLGVPVESRTLNGLDSLLSIVQMPAGVPVGTLAIGRPGRGERRDAGGGHPRREAPALPRGGRALPGPADAGGARRPRPPHWLRRLPSPRRAREGRRPRRRPARLDAGPRRRSARHPLPVPRPVAGGAGRPRRASSSWAHTTTRRRSTASRTGSRWPPTSSRTCPSARRAGSRGERRSSLRREALEVAQDRLAEKRFFESARHLRAALAAGRERGRSRPGRGGAGVPRRAEDAAARLRRQGAGT